MSTISDDWYEESSPNLAATLDPNEKKDHDNQNESNILDEPDVMMANCSLPTPFFRWVFFYYKFDEFYWNRVFLHTYVSAKNIISVLHDTSVLWICVEHLLFIS